MKPFRHHSHLWLPGVLLLLGLIAAGCGGAAGGTAEPTAPAAEAVEVPPGVNRAHEAVLEFMRAGAMECVPPEIARWDVAPGGTDTPEGFAVYRFHSGACAMTITYRTDPAAEELYHVALGDGASGFCWQAMVDATGVVIETGEASNTVEGFGNPAQTYCEAQGFAYELRERADGSLCGMCVFPDGSACNGWAYFHGACGPGDAPAGG